MGNSLNSHSLYNHRRKPLIALAPFGLAPRSDRNYALVCRHLGRRYTGSFILFLRKYGDGKLGSMHLALTYIEHQMLIPGFNTDSTFKSLLTSFAQQFRLSMSPIRVSVAAGVKWMMVISAGAGDVGTQNYQTG